MDHVVPCSEEESFDQLSASVLANAPVQRLVALGKLAIERAGSFEAVCHIRSNAEALRALQRARGASLEATRAFSLPLESLWGFRNGRVM